MSGSSWSNDGRDTEEVRAIREASYANMCAKPSDINEHLPTLRRLASECAHVTEFGMRGGLSTLAFLAAQPKKLVSWDIDPMAVLSQGTLNLLLMAGKTVFEPRVGDSLAVSIERTDMLFIDSLHTFEQLKAELERHANPYSHVSGDTKCKCLVRRYLVFHDTSTYGWVGEDGGHGLVAAIGWFQDRFAFPIWGLIERYENNNGLVVLKHA